MGLNKKTAGILIFSLLGLLLFFSKTIYSHNMPQVRGVRPWRGTLSKLELGSAVADWAVKEGVYAAVPGTVGRVFVREGDPVEEGEPLFEMDFDEAGAERKLAETANHIGKLEGEIGNLRSRLAGLKRALEAPPGEGGGLSGQGGLIFLELEKARLARRNAELNFELGAASGNDLAAARNGLDSLYFKYGAEAEDLEFAIAAKSLDLANLRLAEEAARELLGDYREHRLVRAPSGGTLLLLAAEKGRHFPEKSLLALIGAGDAFILDCPVSPDNSFIAPGDRVALSNAVKTLSGTVRRVRGEPGNRIVTVDLVSPEVSGGEKFDLSFEKTGTAAFTLVPNGAVSQDGDGYFLYLIKRRQGILGEEYYLERLDVFTGDSDHQNTAVIRGINFFEPVVLTTDRPLSPGLTVSLGNPEDFFED